MITVITDLPEGILGADATGQITADDYRKVLVPAIDAATAGGGKVRLLFRLGPEFQGIDPDAMWQDAKLGAAHARAFERVGVVTDVEWLTKSMHAFGWLVPGEVKVFPNAEYDKAVDWLAH
ncbi:MAG: STAS/SEC14 domain-containing protein [Hamadaea sp.]|nr:STAS/SEC14 domain-containing protein [Hamadaea sp.]